MARIFKKFDSKIYNYNTKFIQTSIIKINNDVKIPKQHYDNQKERKIILI